jgi:tetratricopeptide (TPR) repeat protein
MIGGVLQLPEIVSDLESLGEGIPRVVPTPKGAAQFISPNGIPKGAEMKYDFNVLEKRSLELIDSGRAREAIKIYLFMADGDPSLDAGYLGKKLGKCYERIGDLHAAKYWYGRAVEENPTVRQDCIAARKRFEEVTINDLVSPDMYIVP